MKYKIDSEGIRKDVMMVNGWAVGKTLSEPLWFSLSAEIVLMCFQLLWWDVGRTESILNE